MSRQVIPGERDDFLLRQFAHVQRGSISTPKIQHLPVSFIGHIAIPYKFLVIFVFSINEISFQPCRGCRMPGFLARLDHA